MKNEHSAPVISSSFNPHSSHRPSATLYTGDEMAQAEVSILTRAIARVQRHTPHTSKHEIRWFQSSLEPSPECNVRVRPPLPRGVRFNPHSSYRPSATAPLQWRHLAIAVSILTRAIARVQHAVTQ